MSAAGLTHGGMPDVILAHSPEETEAAAARFAAGLRRGDVVVLIGELGAGKTRFVKGVAARFNAHGHVSSPSFVILNRYEGADAERKELLLYHLDLYRVKSADEIYDLGYEEFLFGDGISLIEWGELLGDLLPPRRWEVRFSITGEQSREIRISYVDVQ